MNVFFSCRVGFLLRKQYSIFVKLIKVNDWLGRLYRVKVNLLGIRPNSVLDFEPALFWFLFISI